MIARVWRGWTESARKDDYIAYLGRTGVPELRATPGNRGVYLLYRGVDERTEFVVMSLWDSLDSVKLFAGDDVRAARFYPEDDAFLVDREWTCEHFQVAVSGESG